MLVLCKFQSGYGTSPSEKQIGSFDTKEECAIEVQKRESSANGVNYCVESYGRYQEKDCFAKFGMTDKPEWEQHWISCIFEGNYCVTINKYASMTLSFVELFIVKSYHSSQKIHNILNIFICKS